MFNSNKGRIAAKVHDVVQINENHEWCGAFIYVTEVQRLGIKGFLYIPGKGNSYVRLTEREYDVIGEAALQIGGLD